MLSDNLNFLFEFCYEQKVCDFKPQDAALNLET
jgi:hypothetical protein